MRAMKIAITIASTLCIAGVAYGIAKGARPDLVNVTADPPKRGTQVKMSQPQWEACPDLTRAQSNAPAYLGNKWWGEMTLCSGNARVIIRAESELLGGPALEVSTITSRCWLGESASEPQVVGTDFFEAAPESQVAMIREHVARSLGEVRDDCGEGNAAQDFIDSDFSRRFTEFADRYWR